MSDISQNVLQQIVDYWGQNGKSEHNKLTERDILSLFETLNGHFISRTGEAAKEEVREEEPKIIDCKECGKMFSTQLNLEKHKQIIHSANKEVFPCTVCEKKFMSSTGLSKHMSKHREVVKCSHCDKQFTAQEYLEQHLKIHDGVRFGKTY